MHGRVDLEPFLPVGDPGEVGRVREQQPHAEVGQRLGQRRLPPDLHLRQFERHLPRPGRVEQVRPAWPGRAPAAGRRPAAARPPPPRPRPAPTRASTLRGPRTAWSGSPASSARPPSRRASGTAAGRVAALLERLRPRRPQVERVDHDRPGVRVDQPGREQVADQPAGAALDVGVDLPPGAVRVAAEVGAAGRAARPGLDRGQVAIGHRQGQVGPERVGHAEGDGRVGREGGAGGQRRAELVQVAEHRGQLVPGRAAGAGTDDAERRRHRVRRPGEAAVPVGGQQPVQAEGEPDVRSGHPAHAARAADLVG